MEGIDPEMYLILCLGGSMGLRRAEMANIRMEDIRGTKLIIHGKGHGPTGRMADVEMTQVVLSAMSEYLQMRQDFISKHGDHSEGYLLIQTYKTVGTRLSPDGIGHKVRRLGRERGVDITTHSLRRLFATVMAHNDIDYDTIRRKMRHSNINTTIKCYIEADPTRLAHADSVVDSVHFG